MKAQVSTNTGLLIKTTLIRCLFDILGLIKNSLSGVNIGSSERFYDILYILFFPDTFFNYLGRKKNPKKDEKKNADSIVS